MNYRRLMILFVAGCVILGGGYFLLPSTIFNLGIMALFFLPLAIVLIERPSIIYCLFVVVLFSNIEVYFQFGFFMFLLVAMLTVLAVSVARGRRMVIHDWKFSALLFILLLTLFQSAAVARELGKSLQGLIDIIKVLIFIGIIIQFVSNRAEFKRFIIFAVVGVLLCDLMPFIITPPTGGTQESALMWSYGVYRYAGLIGDANGFGLYQIFIIPLLLFLAITNRRSKLITVAILMIILTAVFMIVLSFSRSSFVSLVSLLIVLMVVERKNRLIMITGSLVILAGILFTPLVFWSRIKSILELGSTLMQDYAVVTRIASMKAAIMMGVENPLFGVGFNNFLSRSSVYMPFYVTVHNILLEIFSGAGFPALAAVIAILIYNLRVIFRMISRKDDPETSHLGRLLLVQYVGIGAMAMFVPGVDELVFWMTVFMPTLAGFAYQIPLRNNSYRGDSACNPAGAK